MLKISHMVKVNMQFHKKLILKSFSMLLFVAAYKSDTIKSGVVPLTLPGLHSSLEAAEHTGAWGEVVSTGVTHV